jgi:hypothetical protein
LATDYTEEVVEPLGFGITAPGGVGSFGPEALRWDCNIGGLTFLFGNNDQFPMTRQTAQFRRERIDTERNPGEQSLENGLWIRSQASWHYGAGLSSAEPLEVNSEEAAFRYYQGGGVDPWTPGQVQLLNQTASVFAQSAASGQQLLGVETGVLLTHGVNLTYITNAGASTAVSWGGTNTIFSVTDTGQVYLVSDVVGIWKGTLPSSNGSKIYNKYYGTPTYSLLRWLKSRLMYAENQGIWEITDLSPSSATLPTPFFENPNAGWRWTDFADGPNAIYAAGYSKESSQIYKIGVTSDTTGVDLAVPVVVVDMPRGEEVLSMYSYVGSFIVVGTTAGVRIASIRSDGSLELGPLVFNGKRVRDAVGFSEYLYVTYEDGVDRGDRVYGAGLRRINLGQILNRDPLLFAWANDLTAPTNFDGAAVSVTVAGGKLWFAVDGAGVVKEQDTFVSSGWIETGRIRLGTMEKKAWRDLRMIAPSTLTGSVTGKASIFGTTAPSTWDTVLTVQPGNTDGYGKLNVAAPGTSSDLWIAFLLTSTTDNTSSARLTGYQVRAVPSPRKTELIKVPLLMFDWETDKQGAKYGSFGNAYAKFNALKNLENDGATVQFVDYTTGESKEVYVEEVTYYRLTPPSLGNRKGSGGICMVTMRTV